MRDLSRREKRWMMLLLIVCGFVLMLLNMRVYNYFGIMPYLWKDYLLHSVPSMICFGGALWLLIAARRK